MSLICLLLMASLPLKERKHGISFLSAPQKPSLLRRNYAGIETIDVALFLCQELWCEGEIGVPELLVTSLLFSVEVIFQPADVCGFKWQWYNTQNTVNV